MLGTRESIVEINLSNLKNNLSFLRSKLNPNTMVMAVVKASAYGSDALIISNFLGEGMILLYENGFKLGLDRGITRRDPIFRIRRKILGLTRGDVWHF